MAAFNADEYLADQAIDLSALSYSANGIRRSPVKEELATALRRAVTAVYGSGYRVDIMSAAQPEGPKGTPGTTGTRRHGTGVAADVWVYDPSGKRLSGDALIPLSQHWLATKQGSVGFPANNGNSLHLDLIGGSGPGAVPLGKGEGKVWYYGKPSGTQRSALNDALTNGTLPSYAIDPAVVAKGLVPPANIPNGPPVPAAATPGLAAFRNNPVESGRFKAAQQPFPAPPVTRAGVAVPQRMETAEQIYSQFPQMRPPGTDVAGIYAGFPMRPAGALPPVPKPPVAPPPTQVAAQSPTDWDKFYSGFGMTRPDAPAPTFDPVFDPMSTQRNRAFFDNHNPRKIPPIPPATIEMAAATMPPAPRLIDMRPNPGANIAQQRAEQAALRNRPPAVVAPQTPPAVGARPGTVPYGPPMAPVGIRTGTQPYGPPMAPTAPIPATRRPVVAPIPATRTAQQPPIPMQRPTLRAPTPMPATMRPQQQQRTPVAITINGGTPMPIPMPRLNRERTVQANARLRDWIMGNGDDATQETPRVGAIQRH